MYNAEKIILWSSVCTLDTVEQVSPMQQVAGSLDKKKLPLTAGDYKWQKFSPSKKDFQL